MTDPVWRTEPNAKSWRDDVSGYYCAIRRGHPQLGLLCGYVGVPATHPWHGKGKDDRVAVPPFWLQRRMNIDDVGVMNLFITAFSDEPVTADAAPVFGVLYCHGGLTYTGTEIVGESPGGLWYFGFDAGHAGDLCPGLWELRQPGGPLHEIHSRFRAIGPDPFPEVYRDMDYMTDQVNKLANQLHVIEMWSRGEVHSAA